MKWQLGIVSCFCAMGIAACQRDTPLDEVKTQELARKTETDELPPENTRTTKIPAPGVPTEPKGLIPQFADVTKQAGIAFTRYDDMRGEHRILEVNGGGVAFFDFDADGFSDLFWSNGCRLPLKSGPGEWTSQLNRNLGDGRFKDISTNAGLALTAYAQGVAVGDYNNDGFDDLYVNCQGGNAFFQNNGDGTFAEVMREAQADSPLWGSSAAFADLDGDGNLDLYLVNYVLASDDPPKLCPNENSPDGYSQCPPTMFPAADDVLFRSNGAGGFEDATEEWGITEPDGKGLGVAVFDFNRDRHPDIYVANDGMPNFLYVNQGPGAASRFENRAGVLGAAVNFHGKAEASMGVACGDADGDGWLDLFLTHFWSETNTLYQNIDSKMFQDETITFGLAPTSRLKLGFGTDFLDADNDGTLDLIIANGHIDDFRHLAGHPPYAQLPQLYRNAGNRFQDVSAWAGDFFQAAGIGRGLATGDWDNDGDIDAAVSFQKSASVLTENQTPTSSKSVVIRLVGGAASNRSAVGTLVEAKGLGQTVVREVIGGGSFQSHSDRRVHLGLGDRENLPEVVVTWPSGHIDRWENLPPGHYVAQEAQAILRLPAIAME